MADIKDFETGQQVCEVRLNSGTNLKPEIIERTIVRTGRKYVYTNSGGKYKKLDNYQEVLVEAVDWGEKRLLFLSRHDAEDYLEKQSLIGWFMRLPYSTIKNYSLAQLREAKKILTGEE